MKRIISFIIIGVMLACLVPFASSAEVLWSDDFNSGVINEADWYPGAFFAEQGGPTKSWHVEDWAGWHVLQSMYGENVSERTYPANITFKVDAWAWEDGGENREDHQIGLWWADYFTEAEGDGRIVYMFFVNYETRKAKLIAAGEGDGENYYESGGYSSGTVVAEWDIPASIPFYMDATEPSVMSLGMRIVGTKIECFVNDQKAISFTAPRMGSRKSPILLVNDGCYAGFDNFVVATGDHNLFNESSVDPTPGPVETETETVIVTDTDESGNVVTRVEVRPVANTGTATTGGTATKTGDAAIIVIAVMIVALGSAVVVGKVCGKR